MLDRPHWRSLRRPRNPRTATAAEARLRRARSLVLEHGWNSTSHQVLDRGMRHWFSAAGDAVVGYAQFAGVRLVAGAPVAASERLASVAAEFEEESRKRHKRVCYFLAEDRLKGSGNYAAHVVGKQPTWTVRSWTQRFDGNSSLRAQRNRAMNKGVHVLEAPACTELAAGLTACHRAWLASKRLPLLGFLAHSDPHAAGPGALNDKRLFLATADAAFPQAGAGAPTRGPAPTVLGYLTAAPIPLRNGWLIDKVVRHPRAPNGTTELLLDAAVRALGEDSTRITLGLAPLARRAEPAAGADDAPAWLLRAERLALRWCSRFYDFEGLYAFKGKFQPDGWESVYLLASEEGVTARDCLALASALLLG